MPSARRNPPPRTGFASAAKALRAKIRACAARSFAARQDVRQDGPAESAAADAAAPALLGARVGPRHGSGRVTGSL